MGGPSKFRRFARYLELLTDTIDDTFSEVPQRYDRTALTTWKVSIDAATEEEPVAGRLLSVLAHLAPEGVPIGWLVDQGTGDDPFFATDAASLERALVALDGYSLITAGDEYVSTHRIVQAATRRQESARCRLATMRLLRRFTPSEADDLETWPRLRLVAPHVQHVVHEAPAVLDDEPEAGVAVLDSAATFLRKGGHASAAIELHEKALATAERHLGPDDPITLTYRNSLARAYQAAGDVERRSPCLSRPWTFVLGSWASTTATPSHRGTASPTRVPRGGGTRPGDPIGWSRPWRTPPTLGASDPLTLASQKSPAGAYQDAGDLRRSISLFKQGFDARTRILGPSHPDSIASQHALAWAYREAGNLGQAIALLGETLEASARVLGPDHPHTLASQHSLAHAYEATGEFARAIPLFKQVVDARTGILGPDHPDTIASVNNLALALWADGQRDRAITAMESAATSAARALSLEPDFARQLAEKLAEMRRMTGDG